jgi:putative pyruvate formate lyase activating enzyme
MPSTKDLLRYYDDCRLCPRDCGANRNLGERGFCGESAGLRLAAAGLHFGEEPPITGAGGSGTIFVTGCNLRCSFCQNYQISQAGLGSEVTPAGFADICLQLQNAGAENINIVTGSHAVPGIIAGLEAAKAGGLRIPVLWNCSSYENAGTLALLNPHIDTYLPDLKTLNPDTAGTLFAAPDYPEKASAALEYLLSTGKPLLIRHLVLPGLLEDTREVLRWFAEKAAGRAQLSVMTQYTPVNRKLNTGMRLAPRYVNESEYAAVLAMLEEFGIEDGFYQELETGSDWTNRPTERNHFSFLTLYSHFQLPPHNFVPKDPKVTVK